MEEGILLDRGVLSNRHVEIVEGALMFTEVDEIELATGFVLEIIARYNIRRVSGLLDNP